MSVYIRERKSKSRGIVGFFFEATAIIVGTDI